jgi:hypothetical protein
MSLDMKAVLVIQAFESGTVRRPIGMCKMMRSSKGSEKDQSLN